MGDNKIHSLDLISNSNRFSLFVYMDLFVYVDLLVNVDYLI